MLPSAMQRLLCTYSSSGPTHDLVMIEKSFYQWTRRREQQDPLAIKFLYIYDRYVERTVIIGYAGTIYHCRANPARN